MHFSLHQTFRMKAPQVLLFALYVRVSCLPSPFSIGNKSPVVYSTLILFSFLVFFLLYKYIFFQLILTLILLPASPLHYSTLILLPVRVGLNFFFELRYLGPVEKLRNGLDKKIPIKKTSKIFLARLETCKKPNVRGCVILCSLTSLFMNRFVILGTQNVQNLILRSMKKVSYRYL